MSGILLVVGSVIIILWGIAHIMPTAKVLAGFGEISRDNKLVVVQTWVSEGLTLVFIGSIVLIASCVGGAGDAVARAVTVASAVMLILGAVWHLFTGSRTPVLPMKICPGVMALVAVLYILAAVSPPAPAAGGVDGAGAANEWRSLIRELSSQYERRYQDEQSMKAALLELDGDEGRFIEETTKYYAAKEKLGPGDAHLLLSITGDAMYRQERATIEACIALLETASGKTQGMQDAAELYKARLSQLREHLNSLE